MSSSPRMFFFLSPIFISLISAEAIAQPSFLYYLCANERGNYSTNSTYHANLNHILSSLLSNDKIGYGFYSAASYGQSINEVHAIGFCIDDVKPDACRQCLNDSTYLLPELCPSQKEAIGWYENCMLRYSNRPILGTVEVLDPVFYFTSNQNVSSEVVDTFNHELANLLGSLRETASAGNSRRKFATEDETAPDFETIYGLAQCTPDLSHRDCNDCLDVAIRYVPQCCNGKAGARIYGPSCYVRYEVYLFYEPTTHDQHDTSSLLHSISGPNASVIVTIAVVSSVGFVILEFTLICVYLRILRKRNK